MKFQYIFSIVFWSFYITMCGVIIWSINYNEWVKNALDFSISEFIWMHIMMTICFSAGVYKLVERSKKFKKYLTYIKQ